MDFQFCFLYFFKLNKQYRPVKLLPIFKRTDEIRWELFNTSNLRTIRDIFIYVHSSKGISRQNLFKAMTTNEIGPPGEAWTGNRKAKKNRIEIEYLHACRYLKLISEKPNGLFVEETTFEKEKDIILNVNKGRQFIKGQKSPSFFAAEIGAWINIIREYIPASEYLWWFMDFNEFPDPLCFSPEEFLLRADKIYSHKEPGSKGSDKIFRSIDNEYWKVPTEVIEDNKIVRKNDYSRLVDEMFPSWFEELGLVETMKVLDEFEFGSGNWKMHYPIRTKSVTAFDMETLIQEKFNKNRKSREKVFIPKLIHEAVHTFGAPIDTIKKSIVDVYEMHENKYLLERSSLQVMKYANQIRRYDSYRKLFINHRGFLRNYLTIKN